MTWLPARLPQALLQEGLACLTYKGDRCAVLQLGGFAQLKSQSCWGALARSTFTYWNPGQRERTRTGRRYLHPLVGCILATALHDASLSNPFLVVW